MSLENVRKILVPIDFSPHSTEALAWAVDLARLLGAQVTIVHVREPVVFIADEGAQLMNDAAEEAAQESARRELEKARSGVTSLNVDAELVVGVPAAEIVRIAKEGEFDLVVLGTHGLTGLKRVLLGSVARQVVHLAPMPVTLVK